MYTYTFLHVMECSKSSRFTCEKKTKRDEQRIKNADNYYQVKMEGKMLLKIKICSEL